MIEQLLEQPSRLPVRMTPGKEISGAGPAKMIAADTK